MKKWRKGKPLRSLKDFYKAYKQGLLLWGEFGRRPFEGRPTHSWFFAQWPFASLLRFLEAGRIFYADFLPQEKTK